ncbi:MAG: hypothetical protein U0984_00955, partial [Prosthecobacter sp.]|nr:hypothetical protein [Prosthecobacter sp.]
NQSTSQAWVAADIGTTNIPGQAMLTQESILLASVGTSLSSSSDSTRFLSVPFAGDVDITARVRYLSNTSSSARAGLMMRESTMANSRGAFIAGGPAAAFGSFGTRATAGTSWIINPGTARPPMWVRLNRTGSNITGYDSLDGVTWTQRGNTTPITIGSTPLVGLVAMSALSTKPTVAAFDNITISTLANRGPVINAGTDQNIGSVQATLTATATDDARPDPTAPLIVTWIQITGPQPATLTPADANIATAQFTAPGAYTFRCTADDGQVRTFDDTIITYSPPTVTLTAADASAGETGLDSANFIVSRDGAPATPLTVAYTIAGTAAGGADYASLSGTATILANDSSASIAITPLADTVAEGDETIQLSLAASSDYLLGASVSDAVILSDLPMDAWRFQQFGSDANNPTLAGDLADRDDDGIENLLEYALGLNPLQPVAAGMPTCEYSGGLCHLVYTKPVAVSGITYLVEWSTNLDLWSTAGVSEQLLGTAAGIQTIRASVTPPLGDSQCFMQLRVTRP